MKIFSGLIFPALPVSETAAAFCKFPPFSPRISRLCSPESALTLQNPTFPRIRIPVCFRQGPIRRGPSIFTRLFGGPAAVSVVCPTIFPFQFHAGFYKSPWGTRHPVLQILSVDELLSGKRVSYPPSGDVRTFKKSTKAKGERAETLPINFEG